MTGMSVEHMTVVSRVLFAISGLLAVSAAVLFFALDIKKCWRMVSGKHTVHREKQQKTKGAAVADQAVTEKLGRISTEMLPQGSMEETELLGREPAGETALQAHGSAGKTELLGHRTAKEAVPTGTEQPDTDGLEIIQDIVYMQDTGTID